MMGNMKVKKANDIRELDLNKLIESKKEKGIKQADLCHTWKYSKPGCAFTSENLLAKAGGEQSHQGPQCLQGQLYIERRRQYRQQL